MIRYLHALIRCPEPSLLQAEKLQLSQPFLVYQMFQSFHHLCKFLLDLLQYVSVYVVLGRPEWDPALQMCLTRVISLDMLTMLFLMQPQVLLAYFVTRACSWLVFRFLSTRTMKQICFSGSPACTGAWDFSFPGARLCILCCKTW